MPQRDGHNGGEDFAVASATAERPASESHDVADVLAPAEPLGAPRRRGPRLTAASLFAGRGYVVTALVSDASMLLLAVVAAFIGAGRAHIRSEAISVVWLFPPIVLAGLAVRGMYRSKITLRILDEAAHVLGATSVAAMIVIALSALSSSAASHVELIARMWVFSMLYVGGGRLVLGLTQRRARAEGVVGKRTLILGAGRIGAQVERRLGEQPELGLRPVGYVDAHPPGEEQGVSRQLPVLGGPDELERIAAATQAEHVILAFLSSRGSDARLVPIARKCDELGLEVSLVPRLFESMNVRVGLEHIGGMPLFRLRNVRPRGWQFAVKHTLDRVVAALLLLLLSPLLIAITIAVKLSSPGPVFFRQRRVGRDDREFDMLKFRTMRGSPDEAGEADAAWAASTVGTSEAEAARAAEDRRTRVGSILRRYSLDELPQLFNVLKGEMSLVGPRPERTSYVRLFQGRIYRYGDRHRVKAGLTGWAQVHGLRGETSLEDRIEWDNYYIENWSLGLDLKILLMTLVAVMSPTD
jgi:exopolysaccharide biosynthesis polyprenyl glycosylphosphotransferase